MKYRHIRQLAGQHNLSMMCRALKVTPQGYHQWFQRCPKRDKRLQEKQKLVGAITEAYKESHHTYGLPRSFELPPTLSTPSQWPRTR